MKLCVKYILLTLFTGHSARMPAEVADTVLTAPHFNHLVK